MERGDTDKGENKSEAGVVEEDMVRTRSPPSIQWVGGAAEGAASVFEPNEELVKVATARGSPVRADWDKQDTEPHTHTVSRKK